MPDTALTISSSLSEAIHVRTSRSVESEAEVIVEGKQKRRAAKSSALPRLINMASFPKVTSNQGIAQNGASMSSMLLGPLNEMETLAQTLFLSLTPGQVKPPAPRVDAFLACDQALAAAVNLSYKHQIKQRKIERLKAEILDLDSRWREICIELEMEKRELDGMMEEADERLESIEQAKKGINYLALVLNWLMDYISIYTVP